MFWHHSFLRKGTHNTKQSQENRAAYCWRTWRVQQGVQKARPTLSRAHTPLLDAAIPVTTDALSGLLTWRKLPLLEQTGAAGGKRSQLQVSCLCLCLTQGALRAGCLHTEGVLSASLGRADWMSSCSARVSSLQTLRWSSAIPVKDSEPRGASTPTYTKEFYKKTYQVFHLVVTFLFLNEKKIYYSDNNKGNYYLLF